MRSRSAVGARPPRRLLVPLVERVLVGALVLYGGALAATTLRPLAHIGFGPCARAAGSRVARAERAFAATARRTNVRDAFVAFIADSGMVLGGPQPARRADIAASPVRRGTLRWRPAHVLAAESGELGLSTGPSESHPGDAPDARIGHGQFATIWVRQDDGAYRFLVDVGISHGAPAAGMPRADDPGPATDSALVDDPACARTATVADAAARQAFADRDAQYVAAAATDWRTAAAAAHAADVHLLRSGRFPMIGRTASVDSIAAWAQPLHARREGWGVARSGDFAWVRGRYTLGDAAAPQESGEFLRVWHRAGDDWRVAVEVLSPARPPRRESGDSVRRGRR